MHQIELRASAIKAEADRIDEGLKAAADVPRLFLLEMEYLRAVQAAKLVWVNSVLEGLRAGRLTWSEAWLREIADELSPAAVGGSE